eukprot:GHVU01090319.1.p3 GENE.GHVU01090319.1~~GHVU01090319.1.p3  ORF type:complete len:114 (-),score=19.15 GHVU01090319.1:2771-3112(-)
MDTEYTEYVRMAKDITKVIVSVGQQPPQELLDLAASNTASRNYMSGGRGRGGYGRGSRGNGRGGGFRGGRGSYGGRGGDGGGRGSGFRAGFAPRHPMAAAGVGGGQHGGGEGW